MFGWPCINFNTEISLSAILIVYIKEVQKPEIARGINLFK